VVGCVWLAGPLSLWLLCGLCSFQPFVAEPNTAIVSAICSGDVYVLKMLSACKVSWQPVPASLRVRTICVVGMCCYYIVLSCFTLTGKAFCTCCCMVWNEWRIQSTLASFFPGCGTHAKLSGSNHSLLPAHVVPNDCFVQSACVVLPVHAATGCLLTEPCMCCALLSLPYLLPQLFCAVGMWR
jgi:hypothetical protein